MNAKGLFMIRWTTRSRHWGCGHTHTTQGLCTIAYHQTCGRAWCRLVEDFVGWRCVWVDEQLELSNNFPPAHEADFADVGCRGRWLAKLSVWC